jgi:hypothetical protein
VGTYAPSPQAEGAAVDLVPKAGAEPPATRLSMEVPAGTAKAPVGSAKVPPDPQGRGRGASPV